MRNDIYNFMKNIEEISKTDISILLKYITENWKFHNNPAILKILIEKLCSHDSEEISYAIMHLKEEIRRIEELKSLTSINTNYILYKPFNVILNRNCEFCNADRIIHISSVICDDPDDSCEEEQITCGKCGKWSGRSEVSINENLEDFDIIGECKITMVSLLRRKGGE